MMRFLRRTRGSGLDVLSSSPADAVTREGEWLFTLACVWVGIGGSGMAVVTFTGWPMRVRV
jgi:hypothetical protein